MGDQTYSTEYTLHVEVNASGVREAEERADNTVLKMLQYIQRRGIRNESSRIYAEGGLEFLDVHGDVKLERQTGINEEILD